MGLYAAVIQLLGFLTLLALGAAAILLGALTVPSGLYHVSATGDGYIAAPPEEVTVPSGLPAAQVDLSLEPAHEDYFIRGAVRRLTERVLPHVAVLSPNELTDRTRLKRLGTVGV